MRNDYQCFSCDQFSDGTLNNRFIFGIGKSGRFIQHNNGDGAATLMEEHIRTAYRALKLGI